MKNKISSYYNSKKRIVYPGAIYHITQRAPGADKMFLEKNDYLYMLYLLKEKSKKFNIEIFSYALLPNHMHLELRINEENLSSAMKNILEIYAMSFNRKYKRKGHVICRRFWSSLCLDDSYILALSLYIHLNPYKAGLVKEPRKFSWSSCSLYTNSKSVKSFIDYVFILKLLDKRIAKAKEKYNDLLNNAIGLDVESVAENPKAVLSFRNKMYKKIKKIIKSCKDSMLYVDEDLSEEIQKFSKKKRVRKPKELKARLYLIRQLQSRGFSNSEIASKLKMNRKSIYNLLNKTKKDCP